MIFPSNAGWFIFSRRGDNVDTSSGRSVAHSDVMTVGDVASGVSRPFPAKSPSTNSRR